MVVDYSIKADDKDITDKIKAGLISLNIKDTVGDHADAITLKLSDYADSIKFPNKSVKISVSLGYKGNLYDFGVFFVDHIGINYPPSAISISGSSVPFAKSTVFKAMQTQHTISFHDTTVKALVELISTEHGLKSAVVESIGKIKINHIDQTAEGNIAFLYRLVSQYGGSLKPTSERLVVLDKRGTNAKNSELPTVKLDLKNITKYSYSSNHDRKYRSVAAQYHDVDKATTETIKVGDGQPEFKLAYMYEDKEKATAIAETVYKGFSQDSDTMNLTTVGNTEIIAGMPIKIIGLRDDIPQDWYVKTASHTLSKQGYQTNAELTLKDFQV